jgi:hypothetical protein
VRSSELIRFQHSDVTTAYAEFRHEAAHDLPETRLALRHHEKCPMGAWGAGEALPVLLEG